jgi:glycerol-3-phosphate dehydrogenase
MITITGGKLTTWRRMAKMTVDRLVEREAREAPCRTAEIPLGQPVADDELPAVEGVGELSRAALAGRYGYGAHEVLAVAQERPELAQPIQSGLPDVLAEVVIAARREQARSVGDVLLRRTRLGLLAARELCGERDGTVAQVSELLGEELGWDRARRRREGENFRREAREEGILVKG